MADSIESSGRTWKVYAEGLPSPGFSGRYAKKHNPGDPARRARIVPLEELRADLAAGRLPDFAFVVPDLCNSMHDCPVRTGDLWLRRVVGPLLKLPRTAIFITFDEGRTSVRGGGHVPTLVVGTPSGADRRSVPSRTTTDCSGRSSKPGVCRFSASRDAPGRSPGSGARKGFGGAAGMRSARCLPLSPQRKPRAIRRRRRTAGV